MPVAGSRAKSRVQEVRDLLDVMKERGVATLKVGDIELTLAQAVPERAAEDEPRRQRTDQEIALAKQKEYRRIALGAGSQIVSRASE